MQHQDFKQVYLGNQIKKQLQDRKTDKFSTLTHEQALTRKLDSNELPDEKKKQISQTFLNDIVQARVSHKWSQKDLATQLNVKPDIIQKIESGKLVPNPQLFSNLKKKLGIQHIKISTE
jgi:ribosome-binding protein aMBF1 (putative translation factor)